MAGGLFARATPAQKAAAIQKMLGTSKGQAMFKAVVGGGNVPFPSAGAAARSGGANIPRGQRQGLFAKATPQQQKTAISTMLKSGGGLGLFVAGVSSLGTKLGLSPSQYVQAVKQFPIGTRLAAVGPQKAAQMLTNPAMRAAFLKEFTKAATSSTGRFFGQRIINVIGGRLPAGKLLPGPGLRPGGGGGRVPARPGVPIGGGGAAPSRGGEFQLPSWTDPGATDVRR